jgi:hypothetical protein
VIAYNPHILTSSTYPYPLTKVFTSKRSTTTTFEHRTDLYEMIT